jgi:hypothetical protein
MDFEDTDTFTASNADIALKSLSKNRKIVEFHPGQEVSSISHKVTYYSENLQAMDHPEGENDLRTVSQRSNGSFWSRFNLMRGGRIER